MNTRFLALTLCFATFLGGCLSKTAKIEKSKTAIEQLIPVAAGISTSDFLKLATQGGTPSMEKMEDQNLTLLIMTRPVSTKKFTQEQLQEFEFPMNASPDPNILANWILDHKLKSSNGREFFTAIPHSIITNYSCNIEGDVATGVFEYKIPKYCRGKVRFLARRDRRKWQITEFSMPARNFKLTLTDNLWKWDK